MSKGKRITVAEYLTQQINISGKQQKEIADELGYTKPNIITMFKQDKTKLPINKVPAMAKALGVDATHLLRLVMSEYSAETWAVIETLLGASMITEHERSIIDLVRENSDGLPLSPASEEEREELKALVLKWKTRYDSHADAARRRVEKENPHMTTTVPPKKNAEPLSQ